MSVKKIIVSYNKSIDGDWFKKERIFDNYKDAWEWITTQDMVYKFTIQLIKDNSK